MKALLADVARLAHLVLPHSEAGGNSAVGAVEIEGVTADSRKVAAGYVFAALAGTAADGSAFIADAVKRGAVAVLARTGTAWPEGVAPRPMITDLEPRRALAMLAAALAGAQPDQIVAVTGTNGKTSTVDFLRQIFLDAGFKAASLGTLGLIAAGHSGGTGLTTPDPVALSEMMAELAAEGITHAALEASSHGLAQFRLDGLRLAAAGFSNFTHDHLDYHGSFAAYRAAKLRLFAELLPAGAPAVVNADMDAQTLWALRDIAAQRHLDLRLVGEYGDAIRLLRATPRPQGQILEVDSHGRRSTIEIALPGRFQADNALMAAGLAQALGVGDALDRMAGLAGVRGRMELCAQLPNGAAAYVDYAHTPDALARLLMALRPHTQGRLVCVFGAGGDRDSTKRPLLGEVAARLADLCIVTDDNPRGEDPALIRAAIMAGCPGAIERGDRADAIAAGLAGLGPGDVLAVAGKGHESGQIIAGTTYPFDDASVIRRLAGCE